MMSDGGKLDHPTRTTAAFATAPATTDGPTLAPTSSERDDESSLRKSRRIKTTQRGTKRVVWVASSYIIPLTLLVIFLYSVSYRNGYDFSTLIEYINWMDVMDYANVDHDGQMIMADLACSRSEGGR